MVSVVTTILGVSEVLLSEELVVAAAPVVLCEDVVVGSALVVVGAAELVV